MEEYIKREALIAHIKDDIQECGEANSSIRPIAYGTILGLRGALSYVETLPSADVVEVVRGKWLDKPMELYCDGEEPFVIGMVDGAPYASCYCSECGEWLVASDEYPVKGNYCPNCGAKMDGKEKDNG